MTNTVLILIIGGAAILALLLAALSLGLLCARGQLRSLLTHCYTSESLGNDQAPPACESAREEEQAARHLGTDPEDITVEESDENMQAVEDPEYLQPDRRHKLSSIRELDSAKVCMEKLKEICPGERQLRMCSDGRTLLIDVHNGQNGVQNQRDAALMCKYALVWCEKTRHVDRLQIITGAGKTSRTGSSIVQKQVKQSLEDYVSKNPSSTFYWDAVEGKVTIEGIRSVTEE